MDSQRGVATKIYQIPQMWYRPSEGHTVSTAKTVYRPAAFVECRMSFPSIGADFRHSDERYYTAWYPTKQVTIDWSSPAVEIKDSDELGGVASAAAGYQSGDYAFNSAFFDKIQEELIEYLVRTTGLQHENIHIIRRALLWVPSDDSTEEKTAAEPAEIKSSDQNEPNSVVVDAKEPSRARRRKRKPSTKKPFTTGCYVELWRDPNFEGESIKLVGTDEYPTLRIGKNWGDQISSLRVGPKAFVLAYPEKNFEGDMRTFGPGEEVADLRDLHFDNEIDSIKVIDSMKIFDCTSSNGSPSPADHE